VFDALASNAAVLNLAWASSTRAWHGDGRGALLDLGFETILVEFGQNEAFLDLIVEISVPALICR
jgi:hypothetical protein